MTKKKVARGRPKLDPADRKDQPLQVRMPPGLIESVREAAKKEGTSVSSLVRELLEGWLAKLQKSK